MATRKPGKPPAAKSSKPAPEEKPRYHHGDLRQALIDAALQLISEEGFAALSLREVARRAGVTHAAPYRHFADKEALLGAVAAEGFRMMTSAMRERMAQEEQLMERLGASGIAYVLFAVAHPAHFRVMFGPHFTRPPEPSLVSDPETNAFGLLVGTIEEGQRAGVLREAPTMELALCAWSMVHGLSSLLVDRKLEQSVAQAGGVEALARAQTRVLFAGLGREARG
jgi:AcrR family transcriptional regulator